MRRLVLSLTILLVAATPATADFRVNGQIAYEWAGHVWLTNQDGSNQRDIALGNQPAWSADGRRIAYVESPHSSPAGELMAMNADGSGQHEIDNDLGPSLTSPSWSPDGTQIAVAAFGDIYAVPVAGGRSRLVAQNGSNPAWSPDGSLIAFTRDSRTVMLVAPDGSNLHPLVPSGTGNTANPPISWSPDGKRIAFTGASDGGIDAVNVDGTGLQQILPHGGFGVSVPAWSPDGSRIAYLENGDLCTAAIGGAAVARLTWTPISKQPPGRPAWQPLPAGSPPAGAPGRSVGPPPGYPVGTPWYPSCDQPGDHVTMTSSGPAFALVGSHIRYTLTLENEGSDPILVTVGDRLHGGVPGAGAPSQGRCDRFTRHAGAWISECELGGLLPGGFATIGIPIRANRVGELENEALRSLDPSGTQVQTVKTDTDVVRCSLRGTPRADRLHGSRSADVVCGYSGADWIDVRGGGTDTVFCGPGRDTVLADPGDWIAPDCEVVRRSSA